jgi:plasmid stabilization system protein ParE
VTRLEFHPEALAEYEFAANHYESHQVGLGNRFVSSVESAIQSILDAPLTWPVLEQDVRRRLTRVFPYAILYSIEPDFVLVLAVMHCHQQPGYWRSRASGT